MQGDPIWTKPEDLSKAVDNYFSLHDDAKTRPTWTGLALHLGFASRQSLWEYSKKDGFSLPIKRALLRIEQTYEEGLAGKNPAGSIFALKNFAWKDRQEIEQSGGLTIKFEEPGTYIYPTQDKGSDGIPESPE